MSEVSAPASEPVESFSQEPAEDAWEEAKEAFEEPQEEVQQQVEETPQQQEVKAEPKSQLEQGEPKAIDLEKLPIPRKYKGAVEEYVKPLLEESSKQVQATNEKLGQYEQGFKSFVDVFRDIVQNPNKIPEYAAQYGELIGLDPSQLQHFDQPQNQPQAETPRPQQPQVSVDSVFDKYADQLLKTSEPREFVTLLRQQNLEIAQAVQDQMMGKVGNLLRAYHEEYIKPDKETLNQFKSKAEQDAAIANHNAMTSSWNSAKESVAKKFSDFGKYEPNIRELLKNDPDFSELRTKINQNPSDVARREKLIERAYHLVSMNDRLTAAKTPKPKFAGLEPNSKHHTTIKPGGSDWDDIKSDPDLGWT